MPNFWSFAGIVAAVACCLVNLALLARRVDQLGADPRMQWDEIRGMHAALAEARSEIANLRDRVAHMGTVQAEWTYKVDALRDAPQPDVPYAVSSAPAFEPQWTPEMRAAVSEEMLANYNQRATWRDTGEPPAESSGTAILHRQRSAERVFNRALTAAVAKAEGVEPPYPGWFEQAYSDLAKHARDAAERAQDGGPVASVGLEGEPKHVTEAAERAVDDPPQTREEVEGLLASYHTKATNPDAV